MVKYYDGTVFNCGAEAIVCTVNTVGVMGAGIALEFALRYPEMVSDYENKCKDEVLRVGKIDWYKTNDTTIVYFPTKWHFKYPSKIEWIRDALADFVMSCDNMGVKSVAFPKLGTLNGGLSWSEVKPLMEKWLGMVDLDVYICLDAVEAQGLEKKMLDVFNGIDLSVGVNGVRLNKKQIEALSQAQPIDRFWKIKGLEGIGITCYSKLFNYCKNRAEDNGGEQIQFIM